MNTKTLKATLTISLALGFTLLFHTPCLSAGVEYRKPTAGTTAKDGAIVERFAPEEINYSISFWIFKNVAEGRFGIRRISETEFEGVFSAWTTGVIEKYILMRADTYTARIKLSKDGKRFLTKSFEKRVQIGERALKRTLTEIDYERGVLIKRSWSGKRLRKTEETEIAQGVTYYDPITAFYNLRFGALGPVELGKKFNIKSFPKDGKDVDIEIEVVDSTRLTTYETEEIATADKFVLITIDKEILESKSGVIEILLSGAMVPTTVVAKDLILFGDVKGEIIEKHGGAPKMLPKNN